MLWRRYPNGEERCIGCKAVWKAKFFARAIGKLLLITEPREEMVKRAPYYALRYRFILNGIYTVVFVKNLFQWDSIVETRVFAYHFEIGGEKY